MSLQAKLDKLKKTFRATASKPVLELMDEAMQALIDSGIMERALGIGDPAPDFTLKNTESLPVHLKSLLKTGPVVLTFYRGRW